MSLDWISIQDDCRNMRWFFKYRSLLFELWTLLFWYYIMVILVRYTEQKNTILRLLYKLTSASKFNFIINYAVARCHIKFVSDEHEITMGWILGVEHQKVKRNIHTKLKSRLHSYGSLDLRKAFSFCLFSVSL